MLYTMEETNVPNEETLKEVIFDLQEPVVFHNILQNGNGSFIWKLLQWNLSELVEKFGDMKLQFRVGYNSRSMVYFIIILSRAIDINKFINLLEKNIIYIFVLSIIVSTMGKAMPY